VVTTVSVAHPVASKAYVVQQNTPSASNRDAAKVDWHKHMYMYVKTNVAHPQALAAREMTTAVKLLRKWMQQT
jgi:hypothetical protein